MKRSNPESPNYVHVLCSRPVLDENERLRCPYCNGQHLTFTGADHFIRASLRDQQGIHARVTQEGACVDSDVCGIYPDVEKEVTVRFCCVDCGEKISLSVRQVKGNTFVEVDPVEE